MKPSKEMDAWKKASSSPITSKTVKGSPLGLTTEEYRALLDYARKPRKPESPAP